MTAPAARPIYNDTIGGTEYEAGFACRMLIEDFASSVGHFPDWELDDTGIAVRLSVLAHEPEKSLTIGFAAGEVAGEVELRPDASGWMLAVVRVGGSELLRAYLDNVYEEFELWPPGAAPDEMRTIESPGRIGKRRSWVSISAAGWPVLQPIANSGGWVNVKERD